MKKTNDEEIAQEINQRVLMKLLNACCSDKNIENSIAWASRITHNTLIDYYREKSKISHQTIREDIKAEVTPNIYSELANFIEPLISFLPEKYAKPLVMADLEGKKQEEIAKQLNISLSGAKSRIQRARKLLLKEIKTCFHLEQEKCGLEGFQLKNTCRPLQEYLSR